MRLVAKIVSGGQTGVDRGAIAAAKASYFPYGGLIPKGRLAEDGIVPEEFTEMKVAPRRDYRFRTEWNVTHSDATLILARRPRDPYPDGELLEGGTLQTKRFCSNHGKPHLVIFTRNLAQVMRWLEKVAAELGKMELVLNVAGPRESKCKGIEKATFEFIQKLIFAVERADPDDGVQDEIDTCGKCRDFRHAEGHKYEGACKALGTDADARDFADPNCFRRK